MAITTTIATGILLVVGLLILVGLMIVLTRLGDVKRRTKWQRPSMPLAWPISPEASFMLSPPVDQSLRQARPGAKATGIGRAHS